MADPLYVEPRLDLLAFSITRACNLRCSFCSRDAGRVGEVLKLEDIRSVLDSIKSLPKPRAVILSGGEPTMHPQFFEMLKAIHGHSKFMIVNTNGTLLTEATVKKMKELGVKSLSISLDGARPEIHDTVRGVRGCFDRTIEGVRLLKSYGIEFSLKATIGELNKKELPGIIELAKLKGASSVGVSRTIPIGRAQNGYRLANWQDYSDALREGITTAKRLGVRLLIDDPLRLLVDDDFKRLVDEEATESTWGGCIAGVTMAYILPNKDVIPCPAFPYPMGNLAKQDFRSIWFSETAKLLRTRDHLEGKCGACSLKKVCGGCRGYAYAVAQNPFAEDTFCPLVM